LPGSRCSAPAPGQRRPKCSNCAKGAIAYFERGELRDVIEPNVYFAFHPAQAADEVLVQRYVDIVLDAGAQQLISQNRAVMRRPDARLHLPLLRAPVLLICGDDGSAGTARMHAGDGRAGAACGSGLAAAMRTHADDGKADLVNAALLVGEAAIAWLAQWN
jgi:hypothetical protein